MSRSAPLLLALAACAAASTYTVAIRDSVPPRPPPCEVDVYHSDPAEPFATIGRVALDGGPGLDDPLAFAKDVGVRVCRGGGDALIARRREGGRYVEADVVRFVDRSHFAARSQQYVERPVATENADAGAVTFDKDEMTPPQVVEGRLPAWREGALPGLMLVKCVVLVDGSLKSCRVIRSLGAIDQEVLEALSTWKMKPAEWKGRPIPVDYVIPVRFVPPPAATEPGTH